MKLFLNDSNEGPCWYLLYKYPSTRSCKKGSAQNDYDINKYMPNTAIKAPATARMDTCSL